MRGDNIKSLLILLLFFSMKQNLRQSLTNQTPPHLKSLAKVVYSKKGDEAGEQASSGYSSRVEGSSTL